jgi:hypothetical protein
MTIVIDKPFASLTGDFLEWICLNLFRVEREWTLASARAGSYWGEDDATLRRRATAKLGSDK